MISMKVDDFLMISNHIIKSRNSLSALEQEVFYAICRYKQIDDFSKIKNFGEHLIENEIVFNKWFLSSYVNSQILSPSKLKVILENISNKHYFYNKSGEFIQIIEDIRLVNKTHIEVNFTNDFYKYFHCKNNFTQLPLQVFYKIKSKNTMKLFELLCMYKYVGVIKIKIDDFRFIMDKENANTSDLNKDINRSIDQLLYMNHLKFYKDADEYIFKFDKFKLLK